MRTLNCRRGAARECEQGCDIRAKLMRGIASRLDIRGISAHEIFKEIVELFGCQGSYVVPFIPMLYHDEIGL
jgi:hypothetical protein